MVFLVTARRRQTAVAGAFGPDAEPDRTVPASLLPPLVDDVHVLLRSDRGGRAARRGLMRAVIGVDLGGTKVAAAALLPRDG